MISPKDVTIIIPHLGATEEQAYSLNQCLVSLHETVPDIKKIVALNDGMGVNGKYKAIMEKLILPNHTLMVLEEQGQNKAVNAAVATTNTPWIFITNDDMVYPPGWFENLTAHIIAEPVSCISPRLVEPRPGAPTFLVEFCGGAGGDFNKQKFLDFVKKYHNESDGAVVSNGFNLPLLIKRELWDTVGGYDINYDPWGSNGDSDLEYKIRLAGVQPLQDTDTLVYHFSQTSGTFSPENDSFRFKNYAYFKEKWGVDRTDAGIWEANFHMPTLDEGRIFTPEWEGKYGQIY